MVMSILIVDDNQSLATLYQIVFERAEWPAGSATSGREALAGLDAGAPAPDVILLDIMMPDMDGVEVCRRIREKYPSPAPFIAVYTANNRPEVRDASLAAGADLFISKNIVPVLELPAYLTQHLKN